MAKMAMRFGGLRRLAGGVTCAGEVRVDDGELRVGSDGELVDELEGGFL